jgi:hypothetical protein
MDLPNQQAIALKELVERSSRSRLVISQQMKDFRQRIDIPTRLRNSINQKSLLWIGGSVIAGLFATKFLPTKKTSFLSTSPQQKRSLTNIIFTTVMALAKPAIKSFILSKLQNKKF